MTGREDRGIFIRARFLLFIGGGVGFSGWIEIKGVRNLSSL